MTVRINFVSSHIAMFLLVPPLLLIGRFISDRRKIFSNSYNNTAPLRPHAMFVAKIRGDIQKYTKYISFSLHFAAIQL